MYRLYKYRLLVVSTEFDVFSFVVVYCGTDTCKNHKKSKIKKKKMYMILVDTICRSVHKFCLPDLCIAFCRNVALNFSPSRCTVVLT